MPTAIQQLIEAESKAAQLFSEIEKQGLIRVGKTEKELNTEVYGLAFELFGIRKYWHKRIVRSGANTLFPYRENPPDLTFGEEDIIFLDFGPVFDAWEADFGRTFVIGKNPAMLKLKEDVEKVWQKGRDFFLQHKENITGAELYAYTRQIAQEAGWEYGNEHCGHLIGEFPHEKIIGEETINYIHPENVLRMSEADKNGRERHWIYEIHLVDRELGIGGFFEQLLV
ncbi:MAG: Xaa-Pro dipeptidase [Crocinitomicaceae bacterium]|jgi:Xaa-Pro aminopeptidase|nr:Xaa-Pro dipeptidase [Crocinitomicaceae bacterium]